MRIVATSHEVQGRISICKEWPDQPLPKEGDQISCHLLGFTGKGTVPVLRVYPDELHIILSLDEIHALLTGSPGWKRQGDPPRERAA